MTFYTINKKKQHRNTFMCNRYDVAQTIDLKQVMDMGFAFENWMAKESVYGLVTDLIRMNLNETALYDF